MLPPRFGKASEALPNSSFDKLRMRPNFGILILSLSKDELG